MGLIISFSSRPVYIQHCEDLTIVGCARSSLHPEVNLAAGVVLLWSLLMTLWLPRFDEGSGYRWLFTSLGKAVLAQHGVIDSEAVGESERALLEYYAGIGTCRFELDRNIKGVLLFLIECGSDTKDPPAKATWRLIGECKKPR